MLCDVRQEEALSRCSESIKHAELQEASLENSSIECFPSNKESMERGCIERLAQGEMTKHNPRTRQQVETNQVRFVHLGSGQGSGQGSGNGVTAQGEGQGPGGQEYSQHPWQHHSLHQRHLQQQWHEQLQHQWQLQHLWCQQPQLIVPATLKTSATFAAQTTDDRVGLSEAVASPTAAPIVTSMQHERSKG